MTTATLSPDRQTVHIARGTWQEQFPVYAIDGRLRFYLSLRDRKSGRYARHYEPTVAALESVKREAGV